MIRQLIAADFRAYWKTFVVVFILSMGVDYFFLAIMHDSWAQYFWLGAGQMCMMITIFIVQYKYGKGDMLLCSLPSTRKQVILSKYIVCLATAAAGLIGLFLNSLVLRFVLLVSPDEYTVFARVETFFIGLLFIMVYMVLYFPLISRIKQPVFFIFLSYIYFVPILMALQRLMPIRSGWADNTHALTFAGLFLLAAGLLYMSYRLTAWLFKNHDL